MIYLDNAATTFPKPNCVKKAIIDAIDLYSFNAGRGSYVQAENTFKMIEETRELIASVVNTTGDKVVFTSSATESLNNILYGLDLNEADTVFVSPFEHNAVVRTLVNCGCKISIIPFDKDTWELDEDSFRDMVIFENPKAVIASHISNVTGFELPYTCIFKIIKENNVKTVTILDCAQSFGLYNIYNEYVDFEIFAGHKSLYAVFGIAGYLNLNNIALNVVKVGGTGSDSLNVYMPENGTQRYEAGSLNAPAIYAIHESLTYLKENRFEQQKLYLTQRLIDGLKSIDDVKVYLPDGYISKGIVSFSIDGLVSEDVGALLADEFNICVRTGYHCAPFVHDFINSKNTGGTIRISIGIFNTQSEIDSVIEAVESIVGL